MSALTPSEQARRGGNRSMGSLLKLLPFAKRYRWHFAAVVLLVIVYNATTVLPPYLVKIAIDSDISGPRPNLHGLWTISLLYVGVVLLSVAANYLQILLVQYAGQSVVREIRVALFQHIERQSMAFFDTNAIGRLVTNVSSDTETVSQFFTNFFLSMLRDGLSLVMVVVAMFELNVRIAAWSMLLIPVLFGISALYRKRLRRAYQTTRTRLSNIMAFLAENLAGIRIIQIFHQEQRQAARFDALNRSHRQASVVEYRTSVLFNRTFEMLGNAAVAAVVWIGGGAVLHKTILFGTLYAFINYIRQFFQPINAITQQWNTLQSAAVAADRIGQVLSVEPAIVDAPNAFPLALEAVRGEVEFEHVTFAYKSEVPVLRDVSFRVPAGSFVGIVGPTGAGKSSLMSLLIRFYDPTSGRILLDGRDIRDIRQTDLHRAVGFVQQEANLFTGTVLDNIRLFRDDISRDAVIAAAEAVGAHEVVNRLPDGYDTFLYSKGANLSMGERQLISFARIVCLNPRVLILDEATANLDSHTEALVSRGLQAVSANRTTLVIAHRLATVRRADCIYVVNQGRIVESGPHEALLCRGGLYAEMYAKSGAAYEDGKMVQPI
ncbi:lipid A ABC transporter permease/ATP-binding protein [Alicyclobacillus contaminans]|uniref:ABC transporter ATP-binding protein n=1 Tax=Alicyclobacillus contaminans TaxID=392016 RepID=UPI000408CC8A|nr:ABC transporter ATP-binding protein [Alicyclobacillus contaminans]GMA51703.1 lipid A ABC transporter permease/ATP-binding protein [Alicyclobacillus contaminans]